jgi:hypothetical protein
MRVAVKEPDNRRRESPRADGRSGGISTTNDQSAAQEACCSVVFDVIVGAWSGGAQQCHKSVVHVQLLVAVKQR